MIWPAPPAAPLPAPAHHPTVTGSTPPPAMPQHQRRYWGVVSSTVCPLSANGNWDFRNLSLSARASLLQYANAGPWPCWPPQAWRKPSAAVIEHHDPCGHDLAMEAWIASHSLTRINPAGASLTAAPAAADQPAMRPADRAKRQRTAVSATRPGPSIPGSGHSAGTIGQSGCRPIHRAELAAPIWAQEFERPNGFYWY
jgi:hypothetical protein